MFIEACAFMRALLTQRRAGQCNPDEGAAASLGYACCVHQLHTLCRRTKAAKVEPAISLLAKINRDARQK